MKNKSAQKRISPFIIPLSVLLFNTLIILFPSQIISSAKNGLLLWFNNVVPSLLPFIIGANILFLSGFTELIGAALEPLSQKLFKISGFGVFALVMGLVSGYPMGAKITASLYENKKITADEAQKLIMFTNNSGPLFILGTVSVSMLHLPSSGILLITAHYLSALTIGLILRNYKSPSEKLRKTYHLKKTITKIKDDYKKNNLTIGSILSESIKSSMDTIVSIGGFIILFSVLSKMLEITGISEMFEKLLTPVFNIVGINPGYIFPITTGILEITNGCKSLSELPPDITSAALIAGIISWGGFSIHAQSISFLSKTKINTFLYLLAKAAQGFLAFLYVYIINIITDIDFSKQATNVFLSEKSSALDSLAASSASFAIIIIIFILFAFASYIFNLYRR